MNITCTELAEEMGVEVEQLLARAKRVVRPGQSKGEGAATVYTEEGADLIRQAEEAPLTVAKLYKARGLNNAGNPRWVYCSIDTFEGKIPVAIPRKLQGKLVGKVFMVEAITDIKGTTFRHEQLGRK